MNDSKSPKDTYLLDSDEDWHGLFTSFDEDDLEWLRRVAELMGAPKTASKADAEGE